MNSDNVTDKESTVESATSRQVARDQDDVVMSQRIIQLKRSRSGYRAILTRRQNELLELMNEKGNINEIKAKCSDIDEAFKKFDIAHNNIHSQLKENNEIDDSEYYYKQQYDQVKSLKHTVNLWILDVEAKIKHQSDVLNPGDSVSQTSSRTSKQSKSSTSSSTKKKLVEETAHRKPLEAKLKAIGERESLEKRRLQLERQREEEDIRIKQAEERWTLKSELAQYVAREQVFAEADAMERANEAVNNRTIGNTNAPPLKTAAKKLDISYFKAKPSASKRSFSDYVPYNKENKNDEESSIFESNNSRDIHQPKQHSGRHLTSRQGNTLTLDNLLVQQQMNAMALSLPKPEVPVFGGDAMEYCNFMRAFENIIEANTNSSSARLYDLVQYTTGDIEDLMRSCLVMDPDEGYHEAKQLLKKRFGQNYRIATAHVDRIIKGPAIKREDGPALQRFSVLLTSCMNTLKEIGYMSKIENPGSLKMIIGRLPYDSRRKWRTIADNITEDKGREITFLDIASFVEKEARISNHSVFGDLSTEYYENANKSTKRLRPEKSKGASFATQTGKGNDGISTRKPLYKPNNFKQTSPVKNCPICNKDHTGAGGVCKVSQHVIRRTHWIR